MAIVKVLAADGSVRAYQARWRGNDGKQVGKTFKTLSEAQGYEARLRVQALDGVLTGGLARKRAPTFAEYWRAVLVPGMKRPSADKGRLDPATIQRYRQACQAHLEPRLGSLPVSRISHDLAEQAILQAKNRRRTGETLSPGSMRNLAAALSAVMAQAVRDGYQRANPTIGLDLPEQQKRDATALDPSEYRRLIAAADEELADLIVVTTGLGLRQGEALAVGGGDNVFDWELSEYRVRKQVRTANALTGTRQQLGPLKTAKSRREVPMDDDVKAAIRRQQDRYAGQDRPALWCAPGGGLLSKNTVNNRWKAALRSADLPESYGMHVLRHTYASWLIAAGINPREIQERMGHASIEETMHTYGHLMKWGSGDITRALMAMKNRDA